MKLKLNLKYFILILIFMLTISINNVVLCDKKYNCYDIATDEWIDNGYLSGEPFYGGNLSLESMTNQITTSNIMTSWDFLMEGVNLDLINEYGLRDSYKKAVQKALTSIETFSGASTNGGEVVSVSQLLGEGRTLKGEKKKAKKNLKKVGVSDKEIAKIIKSFDDVENIEDAVGTGDQDKITDAVTDSVENNPQEEKNDKIFKQPQAIDVSKSTTDSIEGIVSDGKNFLKNGKNPDEFEAINEDNIKSFSNTIYNILLTVGIVVAVAVGGIIGIKLMTASASEKADVKQYILPYVIGCIVVFGAFGLWKIVVTILQGIEI